MSLYIIAVGKLKSSPEKTLIETYLKRLNQPIDIIELDQKQVERNPQIFFERLRAGSFVIALDERGKNFSSQELATTIDKQQGQGHIAFLIGPAEGFMPAIRERADLCISFSKATWPHMLLRVMLIEQIYRALQILSGHPYHK